MDKIIAIDSTLLMEKQAKKGNEPPAFEYASTASQAKAMKEGLTLKTHEKVFQNTSVKVQLVLERQLWAPSMTSLPTRPMYGM